MTIAPCSPVILYHSIADRLPAGWEGRIHNVSPAAFRDQVRWLKRRYRVVDLGSWLDAGRPRGRAVITFDDAYRSVFEEALPVLRREGVPATVFINGGLVQKGRFWRDQVRRLVAEGRVESFLAWLRRKDGAERRLPDAARFYRATKDPSVDSAWIARRVEEYLGANERGAGAGTAGLLARADELVDDPLVAYGNHTWSHYVLSSLDPAEQEQEIAGNLRWMASVTPRPLEVLAFPFGGSADVNPDSLRIARSTGHRAVLYSRDRLNFRARRRDGLAVVERLMAPEGGAGELRRRLYRLGARQLRAAALR